MCVCVCLVQSCSHTSRFVFDTVPHVECETSAARQVRCIYYLFIQSLKASRTQCTLHLQMVFRHVCACWVGLCTHAVCMCCAVRCVRVCCRPYLTVHTDKPHTLSMYSWRNNKFV